jgi:two-component system, LytTR family, response regulator
MTINCIIVDDEPIARDILRTYIAQVPYLNLVGECSDAFEAMQLLNRQPVDLVVLDINMPRLSGLDMLRTLKKYPAIVITSAYSDYALEGFELSVTDYLLKPFSFPRFVQATEKVHQLRQAAGQPVPTAPQDYPTPAAPLQDFIMVKADKKLTKVFFHELTHVEAYGNYIFIYSGPNRIMSKQTLTQFEEQLPSAQFVRIHKSFVVSLKAVKFLEGNELSIGTKKLPIGKVYREDLLRRLHP